MSYDLMVFDSANAPEGRDEFIAWYDEQTQWKEQHGYNDPSAPSPKLRAWFDEMRKEFQPMNGPFATEDFDDPKVTDYSLGRSVIYAAFAWSEAENARERTFDLARKHGVGFFDVSAENGGVWLPVAGGGYECIHGQDSSL
jgi:hypothetical protein